MIKESKYCTDIMKKHFNKELVMTKKGNEDFKNSTKCWICDVKVDVKVRDHFHITGKYRTSMHIDFKWFSCSVHIQFQIKTKFLL